MSTEPERSKFRRILLKVSGEALGGGTNGIDSTTVLAFIREIASVYHLGVQVAVVCGGGNIFRGINADRTIDRTIGDAMGMLATMINGLALREFLRAEELPVTVMAAYPIEGIVESFCADRARGLLENRSILILAGGTGLPYFSTDTAAALRALQIQADVLIKATKVDGVYDKDPENYPDAHLYRFLDYNTVLEKDLKVMDAASIALCRDNGLPVQVFNLLKSGNLKKLISGEPIGTLIHPKGISYGG
ncbi:UMP kinase [bacterium]|nr:UMP kinase [candidate division CSSED10-310 bacterium]